MRLRSVCDVVLMYFAIWRRKQIPIKQSGSKRLRSSNSYHRKVGLLKTKQIDREVVCWFSQKAGFYFVSESELVLRR